MLVTGDFTGSVDFGDGPFLASGSDFDVFVVKLDAAGAHLWSKHFGGLSAQRAHDVATDANANVFLTGELSGSIDFGGNTLNSQGAVDVFIAKLDASGGHLWSKRFGATFDQGGRSIATDAAGNVVGAGQFAATVNFGGGPLTSAGGTDVFVAMLAP